MIDSQSDRDKENKENKENDMASPASQTRTHPPPMSPVLVTVETQHWPPAASSATIETTHSRQSSTEHQSAALSLRPHPATDLDKPESPQLATPVSALSGQSSTSVSRVHITPPESVADSGSEDVEPVPQLQYHHHSASVDNLPMKRKPVSQKTYPPLTESPETGASINRHLTPSNQPRGVSQRPHSLYSDTGRQHSPGLPGSPGWGHRTSSAQSGRSMDNRPISYVDLTEVAYPQPPPPPIPFDNSQLRSNVGSNASLLSSQKTLEMYRKNVKKLNDSESQYAFAMFLIQHAQEAGLAHDGIALLKTRKASPKVNRDLDSTQTTEEQLPDPLELLREAKGILQKLSDRGYPFAQYYLGDGYASGFFNKGSKDLERAFHLFVSASKHGHAESSYRAALCYEFGWGTRKDLAKCVQLYRNAASKNHPGAMTRLGRACLSGDLGLKAYREGLKWLRRATDSADPQYNAAPYHLGLLYKDGFGDDVFKDENYAAQLFTTAADLGHADSAYILGDAYEHGKLSCPRDPGLSVHFYTSAAQQNHAAAMMALCAWYMVGAEPVLPRDENEAFEWARQAAELGRLSCVSGRFSRLTSLGLAKAEYALAYFTEMGIGCRRDPLEANVWYVKAADSGDERAKHRLAAIRAAASGGTPMEVAPAKSGKLSKAAAPTERAGNVKEEKECIVM